MTANTGSLADDEETIIQTPSGQKNYSQSKLTDKITSRILTPGIDYRTRSKDKKLTKPQIIIDDLRNIVKEDIEDAKKQMENIKNMDESEVYSIEGGCSSFDFIVDPEKNTKALEKEIERRVQFRDVIECLDTSLGAFFKIKCMEDQEVKLEKFSKVSEALVHQVERVGKTDSWSPKETEETATLNNVTFTKQGVENIILYDTMSAFKNLSELDWEDLPTASLIIVIRTLLPICKQDGEE